MQQIDCLRIEFSRLEYGSPLGEVASDPEGLNVAATFPLIYACLVEASSSFQYRGLVISEHCHCYTRLKEEPADESAGTLQQSIASRPQPTSAIE
jgi:hypothetical protein